MSPTIEETMLFIQIAHTSQTDKSGKPYWHHPVSVMNRLPENTEHDVKLAALLHDILEDTLYTAFDLLVKGYTYKTVNLVILLTFNGPFYYNGNMPYTTKIKRLIELGNVDAICIKYADMCDNTDSKRLAILPEKQRNYFINKYKEPLKMLKAAIFK